jgi:hypothetical protein
VHVQVGARRPHQQRVGVSDEARQRRHPEPLPHRDDLRLLVRGPERNLRFAWRPKKKLICKPVIFHDFILLYLCGFCDRLEAHLVARLEPHPAFATGLWLGRPP